MRERLEFLVFIAAVAAAMALAFGTALAHDDDDARRHRDVIVIGEDDGEGGQAWLGVSVEEDVDSEDGGARVVGVVPESPADQVGIQRGDIIVGLDGSPVYGPRGLVGKLRDHDVGERVEIEVLRDGDRQALSVELGERPRRWSFRLGDDDDPHSFYWNQEGFEEQMEQLRERLEGMRFEMPRIEGDFQFFGHKPKLGVQLVEATPELREHLGGGADAGVLVGKVMKGMPAEAAGIRVGDLIESVDGETIEDAGDLVRALQDKSGESITIGVIRDRRPLQIDVFLPDPDEEPAKGPRV